MKKRKRKPPRPAYQKRVIAERKLLNAKLEKLSTYLLSVKSLTLPRAERQRLRRQAALMQLYVDVLDERIENFNA